MPENDQTTAVAEEASDEPPHGKPFPPRERRSSSIMQQRIGALGRMFSSGASSVSASPPKSLGLARPGQPRSRTGSVSEPESRSPSPSVSENGDWPRPPSRATSAGPPSTTPKSRRASSTHSEGKRPDLSSVGPYPAGGSAPPRRPSIGEGQRFTLKDLLATGPKLSRKPSTSSKKSAKSSAKSSASSEKGGGSQPGDSTASLLKKYGICERVAIGKGATSVVRLAHKWDRTVEKLYAVKEFRKRRKNETEKEYVKKLTAEFCISSTLHHINVVETVDLVQDENQHWCEVMEYCPGGDLYAAIKRGGMSPAEVECCFRQMLDGVGYLHSQGVAHRDLKPENLFFDARGFLKIGDYGASTVYRLPWEASMHMSTGLCGSEPYIAPEQFSHKPYDARLVDIWACGIVYYCLHFQELPWRVAQQSDPQYAAYATACTASPAPPSSSVSTPQLDRPQTEREKEKEREREKNTHYPATIQNLSPRACRPLLRKMLEPDPKQRFTIEEVLQNPWLAAIEPCTNGGTPKHVHVCARIAAGLPSY